MRSTLAKVLALATEHAGDRTSAMRREAIRVHLDPLRLELELLLNPSERDHRLLMYLVQKLTFIERDGFTDISDADELVSSIRQALSDEVRNARRGIDGAEMERGVDAAFMERWAPVLSTHDVASIVSFAMRLSHVVLKREWERVKRTA